MKRQSGLGIPREYRNPDYTITKIGKVTSTNRYDKHGIIDVVFLDHGKPAPVWVVGNIDRKPSIGDQVLIGYIDSRKDSPYLVGFVKGFSKTDNYINVEEGKIDIKVGTHHIKITTSEASYNGKRIAKQGDTVHVDVNGVTHTGTIQ